MPKTKKKDIKIGDVVRFTDAAFLHVGWKMPSGWKSMSYIIEEVDSTWNTVRGHIVGHRNECSNEAYFTEGEIEVDPFLTEVYRAQAR